MKKTVAMTVGFVLSILLVTTVNAGTNDGSDIQQKSGLSNRNKAVIQKNEAAQKRKDLVQSGSTGTAPKKNLSKRNKTMIQQNEAAKTRKNMIKSSTSNSVSK